ncbi:MAG: hypothetical protein ABI689_14175 [Thermoanaerobaculia bacterium]
MEWIRGAHAAGMPLNITAVRRSAPEILQTAFAIRPFWGWRRAIEAAGLSYDRIAIELLDFVRCEDCGWTRRSLTLHLWKQHGFEAGDYLREYPGAQVHAETMRARLLSSVGFAPHWEPLWSDEYVLDRVSCYGENGASLNVKSVTQADSALVGMAKLRFGSWDEVLRRLGLDPDEVRIVERQKRYSRAALLAAIRARYSSGAPMNAAAVARESSPIWNASRKLFKSYQKALAAAGLDPGALYLLKRFGRAETRRLFARARRVAEDRGPGHARELAALHRECGSFVRQKYGGFRELALRLGVPARRLMKGGGWDRAAVVEELLRRQRRGESVSPGRLHAENKPLYLAVVRYFGTFEECFERLGLPAPEVGKVHLAMLRDPGALLAAIRAAYERAPAAGVVTGTDMLRYTKLAWLSRLHFGSWDEGLRRALRGSPRGAPRDRLDVVRYTDPVTVDADLARLVRGSYRGGVTKRRALFLAAHRLRDSIIGALEDAGASRRRALAMAIQFDSKYTSGGDVLREIERRGRAGIEPIARHVKTGKQADPELAKVAKLMFGSWEGAVAAS